MTTETLPKSNQRDDPALGRRLGLSSATALVVGEVIGVGIFLTPASMARSLASPALLGAVWLAMGAVAMAGALCFGTLSARNPEVGGCYVFLKRAYGPGAGFLYGWQSLLVTDPGVTAALAAGLATYVGSFVALSPLGAKAVSIAAILVMAAVNMVGRGFDAVMLRGMALMKVVLLAVIALWGFGLGLGDWSNFMPLVARRPGVPPLFDAIAGGLVAAFFSFGGWWDLSKLAGEVREPARNVPRALMLGVAVVTGVYLLVSAVFLYLVPLGQVVSEQGFAAQVGRRLFGNSGEMIFAGIVIITVLGSLAAILMAAPRVYYAMARDGFFAPALAEVDTRFQTPARAIALQALLASLLVATGGFEQILAYFIFPALAFLVLTIASLFGRARREAGASLPSVVGHPITPIAFIVPTILLMILLAAKDPMRTGVGVAVVAAGVPAYWLLSRRRHGKGLVVDSLTCD